MSQMETPIDVRELCALLQCLGFTVKSLDTSDINASQDNGIRSVVVNCQVSGFRMEMECPGVVCSCPVPSDQNSGFWQVSGVAGGKRLDKESGSALLGCLPKSQRERLSLELREMIRFIREHNDDEIGTVRDREVNKSSSMIELKTPEKRSINLKVETPTRYRSLDTLTAARESDQPLPTPGLLQKRHLANNSTDDGNCDKKVMCRRQSTYTLSSTASSVRRRNKTSSPINVPQNTILDTLLAAERTAEELKNKLANVIREYVDEGRNDSSMSSLVLDVSKISILKGAESTKAQYASSPNISGLGAFDDPHGKLKRYESASTSNLSGKMTPSKLGKSRLRRISPNIFKLASKKDSPTIKLEKKVQDKASKFNGLFKPRIVTPVRIPKSHAESSPNLSSTKKKYSHVKSTIPRPTPKKE